MIVVIPSHSHSYFHSSVHSVRAGHRHPIDFILVVIGTQLSAANLAVASRNAPYQILLICQEYICNIHLLCRHTSNKPAVTVPTKNAVAKGKN